jgi:hypothetical protein
MKALRPLAYLTSLVLCIGPLLLSGCGISNPYKKNSEGFYEKHYNCCGPIALEKALNSFWSKPHDGVIYCFLKPFDRKEISQSIQKSGMHFKECLAYFDPRAICITWPSEIKDVLEKYNIETVKLDSLDELDPKKDIAIVLVHGKCLSREFHWLVFPIDSISDYYGKDTVIDKIYLMKLKK